MHEMAIVTSIIDAICQKAEEEGANRVVTCSLLVGEVRDIHEELLQQYFDWFSRGTAAEGVEVTMTTIPLRYQCRECGRLYGYKLKEGRITDPFGELLEIPGSLEGADGAHIGHDGEAYDCGHGHCAPAQEPHCLDHPESEIAIVSGMELLINDIGVM